MKHFLTTLGAAVALAGSALGIAAASHAPTIMERGSIATLHSAPGSLVPVDPLNNGLRKLRAPGAAKSMFKAPQRVTAAGGHVYAWYGLGQPGALYEVTPDGLETVWTSDADPVLRNCYLREGKLCGPALVTNGMGIYGGYWREQDFATGEVVFNEEWNLYEDPIYECVCYNPDDDCIYAVAQSFSFDTDGPALVKAPADRPKQAEVLYVFPSLQECFTGICYSGAEKCLYAMNQLGEFSKALTDGTVETLYSVNLSDLGCDWVKSWTCGLTYSPADNLIYMSPLGMEESWIVTIDPATGATAMVCDSNLWISTMLTTDEAYRELKTPAQVEMQSLNFQGGSLSGSITYKAPTEYVDGSVLSGQMQMTVELDEAFYTSMSVTAGESVEVDFSNLSNALHKFAAYVNVEGIDSRATRTTAFIGYDVPLAPANVRLTAEGVSWTAVTGSVDGGYVPYAQLQYEVSINGESVGTTTATSLAYQLPTDKELDLYTATVTASYTNPATQQPVVSAPGTSNSLGSGTAYTLPMTIYPTPEQAKLCKIIDTNGDGISWYYAADYSAFEIESNYRDGWPMDDWLIMPAFSVTDPSKFYSLSFEINMLWYYADTVEVCIGTAPTAEAMTQTVIPSFTPDKVNPDFGLVSTLFTVPEAGNWYIGFHLNSPVDQIGCLLRNIVVDDKNITSQSPAAVTGLTAECAPEGGLSATVSFDLPVVNISGTPLDASARITATITGAETVTLNGTPGQHMTAEVATVQGNNVLLVETGVGELGGQSATIDVYTGVHIPAAISGLTYNISPDMATINLNWQTVTEGTDGGYVDPDGVMYMVYVIGQFEFETFEHIHTTSFSYTVPDGTPVHQVTVGVVSMNVAGSNWQMMAATPYIGHPYDLPIYEGYNGATDLMPWLPYTPVEGVAGNFGIDYLTNITGEPSEEIAMFMTGDEGAEGMLGVPFFNTVGVEEAVMKLTCNTGYAFPEVAIFASDGNLENMFYVCDVAPTQGTGMFTEVEITLPAELMGLPAATIYIAIMLEDEDELFVMTDMSIEPTKVVGVKSATSADGVYGGKGTLTVKGYEGQAVSVHNLGGMTVGRFNMGKDVKTVQLPAGIYTVRAGKNTHKVTVK